MKQEKKSLLCRGKECVIGHIKEHKKIYRGGGIVFGAMLTIIILLAVFGTFGMQANKIGGQEEKALMIFYKIEEIAHKRDNILHDIGKEHFKIWEANFHTIEDEFHQTDDLTEKFKLAQKIDSLIHWQAGFTELQGYVSQNEQDQFNQLEAKFDSLYESPGVKSWIGKSDAFKQQASDIFDQLRNIAEKRDAIIQSLGSDSFLAWNVSYQEYTSKFTTATTIEEKYELTKNISNLMYRQDEYFKQQGYIGTGKYISDEEEKAYQQAQDGFNALK